MALTEGQAVYTAGMIKFEYYLKGQLGNSRVVFGEKGVILQQTDYYPFGLVIDRNSTVQPQNARNATNRYLYNGKELQVGTGYVDYGARMYMPESGRWGVIDPLSEKYLNLSSYSYVANNPLKYIDPDGKDIILVVSRDKNGNADLTLRYQNNKFYNQDGSVYKQGSLTGLSNRVLGALNNIRKSDSYLEKIISTLESTKSADHIIEFTNKVEGSKVKGNPNNVDPKSSLMLLDPDDLFKPLDSGEEGKLDCINTLLLMTVRG